MQGSYANDVDVIVIGAGAAGLAASRTLLAAGCRVAILEARDRIGGRAWTEQGAGGPFDHGASFIHAEHANPWTTIARRLQVPTIVDPRRRQLFVDGRPATPNEQAALAEARAQAMNQVMVAGRKRGDISIEDAVTVSGPWSAYARAALGPWLLGAENQHADAADFAAAVDGRDRLVPRGYGSLVGLYGQGLPVTLDAAVERIDYSGRGVVAHSTRGVLRGRMAIVTLPIGVLAAERVRFTPPLPLGMLRAIEALPMGLLAKVVLHFEGDPFALGDTVFVYPHEAGRQPAACHLRPCGHAHVTTFVGGGLARELEEAGEAAAAAFALEPLLKIFGTHLKKRLRGVRHTRWGADPFALGSYAVARPGGAPMRSVLATPLADRLMFAGEASADDGWAATVAGAHRCGKRAARRALAMLGSTSVATSPLTTGSR